MVLKPLYTFFWLANIPEKVVILGSAACRIVERGQRNGNYRRVTRVQGTSSFVNSVLFIKTVITFERKGIEGSFLAGIFVIIFMTTLTNKNS